MSDKIVISKPGIDAGTATQANDLIFSSDYNTLKYATSGTYAMTTNTTTVATITHNLGYVPFHVCFVNQFDSGVGSLPPKAGGTSQFATVEYFDLSSPIRAARAYVDNTNLYLSYNAGAVPTMTLLWYYKIFKNNTSL